MNLIDYGWNASLEELAKNKFEDGRSIARVVSEYKGQYKIASEHGFFLAEVSGKMRHLALRREDYPAVGDWVSVDERPADMKATIRGILPRFSKFSRNMAGLTTEEQIVAANINTVFLVMALNHDFNVRRLERYLTMAWESGANPVIVLSKSDLCDHIDEKVSEVEEIAFGVPIHAVSAVHDSGKEQLKTYLGKGKTVVFLGSSGAGKSTLTNWLYGRELQTVNSVREDDDRGRHTTTNRELVVLPTGGVVIDTPGMRELQLWTASNQSVGQSFADIEALAADCRFRDCTHSGEPGCEVRAALASGRLERARFDSYIKLQRELAFLKRKTDKLAMLKEKERWKKIHMSLRKKH
ncbi:ribosome small subunit-dependent GTPase A [Sporolactobacillus pectinivorans]|uniref:ribosome small subunit-dependent GTPase A n=1 Tax=Sporolactobacillus pectinivorans TaxID=1591408 RepID=UPI003B8467F2